MKDAPRPSTSGRQRLRWRLTGYWLVFFLIVGLVLVLALVSWHRAPRPMQAALLGPATLCAQRSEHYFACLTVKTGHGAERTIFSATLPMTKRWGPVRPWVDMTITSAC